MECNRKAEFMGQRQKEETALFYIGWALIAIICFLGILYWLFPAPFSKLLLPCMVQSTLGIYCPGCGGTRAVAALIHGDFLGSFACHPLVPYTAVIGGWFLFSQTVARISKRRLDIGMRYKDGYVWAALGIVIVNFILKNLLLIVWKVDLLGNFRL